MTRHCRGPLSCTAQPLFYVGLLPAVAGVAGVGACGNHVRAVMREMMGTHGSEWVRVRLVRGADFAGHDGSTGVDHEVWGEAGDG